MKDGDPGKFPCMFLFLILSISAFSSLTALDPQKSVSQYIHKKWTVEDGLPQQVLSIAQTPDGYIWLGTIEGLFYFDGTKFSKYEASDQSPLKAGYAIFKVITAADGTIWFAASNKGIYRLKDKNLDFFDMHRGLSSNEVISMALDPGGSIWIGTIGFGLNRLHNGKITLYAVKDGLASNNVNTLHADRQSTLWVGSERGLTRWQNGKSVIFTQRDGLLSNYITSVYKDSQGRIWIGTDKGLHLLKNKNPLPWQNLNRLTSPHVTAIYEDRDGNLWIGTRGGLNRIHEDKIVTFTDKDGLSNNYVRSIFQDIEGNLWIGTAGGLDQLRDGKITAFSKNEGLSSDYITCIYEDDQGKLWIGNGERGVDVLQNNRISSYSTKEGLAHNNVSAIWGDRENAIWIGTWGAGISRLKNGVWKGVNTDSGLCSNFVNAIYQDSHNDIWVGTDGGGANRIRQGRLIWYSTANGLGGNFISFFHEDHEGNLWIGTEDGGLSRYRDGRFTHFNFKDGLSENHITCMHEDKDGNLWFGTRHSGLNLFRNGKFTVFSRSSGLFHDTIYSILEDQRKNLWMSSPQGIFSVNRMDLLLFAEGKIPSLTCTLYGKAEGMRNIQCVGHSQNAGWKSRDGRLWFPTMEGVVIIDPVHIQINWRPPEVKIEAFTVDNQAFPTDREIISLPPGRKRFEFQYTALFLSSPEKVLFKYRLEGFDPDWVDARTRHSAYYTAISPGKYEFRVIACNNDGIWNEAGATLSFYLRPHFYQTRLFRSICILILIAIGFSIYGVRVTSLKKNHQELSNLVQERTRELETEKMKLEKANEAKSEFLSFAAHDLKNPLQSITGYAEMIENNSSADPKILQGARRIVHAAERMLGLIDELMQSSMIENGQIAISRKPINLVQLTQRLIQSFQSLSQQKNQRLVLSAIPGLSADCDEELIQQTFENILSNAIKFSPGGKTIWVSLSDVGTMVRFSVKDEGPGLTESDKKKIFGRFQRLSAQPTGGESSTGLGLFIAKQLIELHGGRIWVESEPGAGSTFIIELPKPS